MKSPSVISEIHWMAGGSTYRAATTMAPPSTAMPTKACPRPHVTSAHASSPGPASPATKVSTITTTRSCTSRTPTAICPYRAPRSPCFSSSLTTTTVLLNMTATAMTTDSTAPYPKSADKSPPPSAVPAICTPPPSAVPAICTPPATKAVVPTSLILSRLSSSPTRNSSKIMPNSAMSSMVWVTSSTPNAGPSSRPAPMYATMLGTRTARATIVTPKAASSMIPRPRSSSNSIIDGNLHSWNKNGGITTGTSSAPIGGAFAFPWAPRTKTE